MQCDYLEWKGGIFGGYYCQKDEKYVDSYTRNTYCDNSLNYRECSIYKKSSSTGGCYLTTTMCNILGYEDNCITLDTLINFRDEYMKETPECLPLLKDYDIVGPKICEKLEKDENKTRTAHIMLIEYITPAINCINNGYYDDAIEFYKDMTLSLMHYYGLDTKDFSCEKEKQKEIEIKVQQVINPSKIRTLEFSV